MITKGNRGLQLGAILFAGSLILGQSYFIQSHGQYAAIPWLGQAINGLHYPLILLVGLALGRVAGKITLTLLSTAVVIPMGILVYWSFMQVPVWMGVGGNPQAHLNLAIYYGSLAVILGIPVMMLGGFLGVFLGEKWD